MDGKIHKANIKFSIFTATSKLLVLLFAVSFVYLPFNNALAASFSQSESSFQIKLLDAKYLSQLSTVGDNISHHFITASAEQFQNVYSFSSHYSLAALQTYMQGDFVYLEPLRQLQSQAVVVNDPGFSSNPMDVDKEWGLVKAGFDSAWANNTGNKNNIVAVVDTGIDETHEDLKTINYVQGFNFVTNQPIPVGINSDDNGHGTLVTGVLGATPNNGLGIAGTNWQITVMPIKALDANGKGDAVTVAEAIVWATDHGAQFMNLSIGGIGFGHDTTLANAVSYAFNKNVVVVAAAGNDVAVTGGSLDLNPVFPICDDNNYNMVIGVGATDQNDLKPEFSNYGKNCLDVSAPGKRILSTISFDPLTKKSSPNSYAYASGTSLAVPFVVGQATLIKSLYPQATNIQIRDRIISTADPIDNLNLAQCAGNSCRGLLGSGRINVVKSLAGAISQTFSEGDLVKTTDAGGIIYQIIGGQKRLISSFVFNQRFSPSTIIKTGLLTQLSSYPEGPYVTPQDGTLVKFDNSATVYYIQNGQKLPITASVFKQRNFNIAAINTLSFAELDSWPTTNFLAPQEGTLLRTIKNKTVYWVVGSVLHPINYNFFVDRGLNLFPVLSVADSDIAGYAKGEAYIR